MSKKQHLSSLCLTISTLGATFGQNGKKSYARFLIKPEVTIRFCWFSWTNFGGLSLQNIRIWTKSDKNYDRESAAYETIKMDAYDVTDQIEVYLQNLIKTALAYSLETVCVNFMIIKIGSAY